MVASTASGIFATIGGSETHMPNAIIYVEILGSGWSGCICNCVSSVGRRLCLNQSVLLSVLLLYDVRVEGALSSEVSALAYRAVPTTVGYHATSATWLQYYVAMLIDITLRFTWILYIAIPQQLQHSAITSFGMSVCEVCRRGVLSLFRIKNEHCARTSRPRTCGTLPYDSRYIPELEPEDAFPGVRLQNEAVVV
jgi:hypothetical protein